MSDETINIKILLDTANSAKSIGDTRKAIKDLTSAALQVGEGTAEFQQLTQAAGELKDKLDDTRGAVKFFSDDMRNLNGAISIAKGVAAGFEIAQASMALFGAENKNVEKALLKVQSAMALLNGVMAIQEVLQKTSKASLFVTNTLRAITVRLAGQEAVNEAKVAAAKVADGTATVGLTIAQRALNAAMNANPVGILITVIVALVGTLSLLTSSTDDAKEAQKKKNEEDVKAKELTEKRIVANRNFNELLKNGIIDQENDIKVMKARGAALAEVYAAEDKLITETIAEIEKAGAQRGYWTSQERKEMRSLKADRLVLKEEFIKNQKAETEKQTEESRKRIKLAKEESDKIIKIQKESDDASELALEEFNMIFLTKKEQEYQILLNTHQKEKDALIEKNAADIAIIEATSKKRAVKDAEIAKLRNTFNSTMVVTEANQYGDLLKFKQTLDETYVTKSQETNLALLENQVNLGEALRLKEIIANDALEQSTEDKEANLLAITQKYNALKITNLKALETEKNRILKEEFDTNIKELDEELNKLREKELEKKRIADEYVTEYKQRYDALANNVDENARREGAIELAKYQELKDLAVKNSEVQTAILQNALVERKELVLNYNKEVLANTTATSDATIALQTKETVSLKEKLDAWTSYYQQLGGEILNLFAQIDANITAGNISIIEQRKAAALKAFDEEQEAYENLTNKKSNADQAKFDKDKEFADKKAAIEAEFDKQKRDIEYEAAVRNWEYSMAQSVINAAGFILKAGSETGLPGAGAAAILGAVQVAAIVTNPPQKLATGGYVSGEGGPTDDKIPAMLSNGEYVVKAATVKKLGVPMLDLLNNGVSIPSMPINNYYASGGQVSINNQVDVSNIEKILAAYLSQPIKTYVTSSDVTNGQRSDDRLKSRTSF